MSPNIRIGIFLSQLAQGQDQTTRLLSISSLSVSVLGFLVALTALVLNFKKEVAPFRRVGLQLHRAENLNKLSILVGVDTDLNANLKDVPYYTLRICNAGSTPITIERWGLDVLRSRLSRNTGTVNVIAPNSGTKEGLPLNMPAGTQMYWFFWECGLVQADVKKVLGSQSSPTSRKCEDFDWVRSFVLLGSGEQVHSSAIRI